MGSKPHLDNLPSAALTEKSSSGIIDGEWSAVIKEGSVNVPPVAVAQSTILLIGFGVFALATIWPPLILLVTYLASNLLPYCFRTNDDAVTRRQLLHHFEHSDELSASLREIPEDIELVNGYWTNSRGLLMYYTILTPKDQPIKAILCHCHGYTDTPTYTKRKELASIAQHGIAVIMVDYEGHGNSDGTLGLIKDWDVLVGDVHAFFQDMTNREFPGKKVFLWGESLGGAVAYTISKEYSDAYAGVVFVAPMCKIAPNMMPPDWVVQIGRLISGPTGTVSPMGYLPLAPTKGDLKMLTYKLGYKRSLYTRVPSIFARKPRLATAREMLNATKRISESLSEFDAPFLIQHGRADQVTDPLLSQALYDECKSEDKTIRLYDGMWHSLTGGEPAENVEIVLNDSIKWILERVGDEKKKR